MTSNSLLSVIITVVYFASLNMVVMYGVSTLLPAAKSLHLLFKFPVYIVTFALLTGANVWAMSPFKNIKKEKKKPIGYWGLIMYTCLSGIIYLYIRYGNSLPQ